MSESHPRCRVIATQDGAAPPPPFTLTYHRSPETLIVNAETNEVQTETVVTRKLGTHGKGYISVTTKSTGLHKIIVSNGAQDQREAAWGWTELGDTALLNLYNILGAALGDPK